MCMPFQALSSGAQWSVQVIEKAYKKLRLDALVIQQGRLTQNTSKVGKDDLLSMVKYGAEQVFSSEPAKITDEDIDAIISKGESDTVRSLSLIVDRPAVPLVSLPFIAALRRGLTLNVIAWPPCPAAHSSALGL